MTSFKHNSLNYVILFAISVLTLGAQDHSFNPGLDGSYFWAFNYLICFKPTELDKITFIYGPLAFLHYPVCYGALIIIGSFFQIILKFILGYCLFKLSQFLNIDKRIAFAAFALACLTMFSPEAYLNIIIILLLIIYSFDNKLSYLLMTGTLTAMGYYYKCSIGLSAILFQAAFITFITLSSKKIDFRLLFKLFLINFSLWFGLGIILFRSVSPVFESLVTYYQNIIAFNETSALYSRSENFVLLILSGVSLIVIYFINKNKTFRLFWLLSLLFLYTGYTHSIVRMDYSHYIGFLLYLSLVIVVSIVFYKTISKYTFPLLIIAFFCYYGNISAKKDYSDLIINIPNGPSNFTGYVLNHSRHKSKCLAQSKAILKRNYLLSSSTLEEIRKGTVDFFPWDLSYIEANNLQNWKPRPYLQSLNMSSYFDKKTADYFASDKAPDRIIWHGNLNDFMAGIDNSYFLNNEFHSVCSIIQNYEAIKTPDNVMLLTKRVKPIVLKTDTITNTREVESNTWITLPQTNDILGCSISYNFNLLRGLKKIAYRDDEFFIEYKTASNLKFKKRIWPNDAKEFIWLNPYITSIHDSTGFRNITEVRFSNTNKMIHSGKLKIQFKTLKFEGAESKKALYTWLNP